MICCSKGKLEFSAEKLKVFGSFKFQTMVQVTGCWSLVEVLQISDEVSLILGKEKFLSPRFGNVFSLDAIFDPFEAFCVECRYAVLIRIFFSVFPENLSHHGRFFVPPELADHPRSQRVPAEAPEHPQAIQHGKFALGDLFTF